MFRVEEGVSRGVKFHRLWVADRFVEIPEDATPGIVFIQIIRLRNFCEEVFGASDPTRQHFYGRSIPELLDVPLKTKPITTITPLAKGATVTVSGLRRVTKRRFKKAKPRKQKGRK